MNESASAEAVKIEEILEGLTEAQKRALVGAELVTNSVWTLPEGTPSSVVGRLRKAGIVCPNSRMVSIYGYRVRAHLEQTP